MDSILQETIYALANASDERELYLCLMDKADECFHIKHWGFYLFDRNYCPTKVEVRGLPSNFIDRYEQVGREIDPLIRYVIQWHTPIHEALLMTEEEWQQSSLYRYVGCHYDHRHVMTGPVVGNGQLIGSINFARGSCTSPFSQEELTRFNILCSHFSSCLAFLRMKPIAPGLSSAIHLTQRELQIADLVSRGLKNAEIGEELWISQSAVKQALKRIFRKCNVSSRTEMIALLMEGGLLGCCEKREL